MLKVRYSTMTGLYERASNQGHPFVRVQDAVLDTSHLGQICKDPLKNRHVRGNTPIVFTSLYHGEPKEY